MGFNLEERYREEHEARMAYQDVVYGTANRLEAYRPEWKVIAVDQILDRVDDLIRQCHELHR